jgi:choline-sulfatase
MTQQPNILVIIADQLAWRALAAYGNTIARTPNIDRIAEKAVRFTECYTPCPLCQPARAAFWTSRYPHETGVLSNGRRHYVPTVPETMPTLGELFTGALPVAAEQAWPVNYDTLQDRHATVKTVDWLHSYDGDAPFVTIADLQNPHNICGWVGENAGTHTDVPIDGPLPPLPGNFEDADLDRRPRPIQYICCSHNRLSQAAPWTEENYRHYLAAYYHYLARVDAEIGLILDAFEARGDAENTLVVFMADHGDGMASHRMVTKQVSFIEETTHVPFMVAGSSHLVAGRRTVDAPISLLDLVPTLCDLGGIELKDRFRGRSLRPWLES